MRTLLLMSSLAIGLAPVQDLATEYKAGVGRKVTIESSVRMETTASEMERDGEKSSRGVGASSETERTEVHVDHVVEAEGGKPSKVRRHFVELGGKSAFEMGENSRETELESPWRGVTLELTAESDGKVAAEVVAGTEPDGEGALEGHSLAMFLDAFLPKKAVEEGGDWELTSEQILRGLRLDVQRKLYPPPAPPESAGGAGGGGGRRGGGGMGGGSEFLTQSEWKGTAKLAGTEEKNGVACAVIELELETSGEREIEARGGGRGGMLAAPAENKRSWTVKLEGKLWYDVKAKRPVALDIDGNAKIETRTEREREGSVTKSYSQQDGKIEFVVEVEDAPPEEKKPAK